MSGLEKVFMFSGQGSQYFQMGRTLFDTNAVFRQWMFRLDEIARNFNNISILDVLYSPINQRHDVFDRTILTHPAVFIVEYSLTQALIHAGIIPDVVMGVSLGSYTAAAVAGCLSVGDAIEAVIRQATIVEEVCEPGGMLAILASPSLFQEGFLIEHSELAGISFSSHFVISATQMRLSAIEKCLRERNVSFQRLPVSYAFHSKWIDTAHQPFDLFMRSIPLGTCKLPLVCCDRATILSGLSMDFFWRVIRQPMRFLETVSYLEKSGPRRYIDVGPAGSLATFMKYALPGSSRSQIHAIMTPHSNDRRNLAALLEFA